MKKKGFTLIELLAVIVILAIIALIATPMIMDVIEKARRGAAIESLNGILDAAEKYQLESMLEGSELPKVIDLTSNLLEYKGAKPDNGTLIIGENGKMYIIAKYGKYCIEKGYETVSSEVVETKNCNGYNIYNNMGMVTGATKQDGYVTFDGDDIIRLGLENYDFKDSITVAVTFTADIVDSEYKNIISNAESGGFSLRINPKGNIYSSIRLNETNSYCHLQGNTIQQGIKYTAIMIYDGKKMSIYINGKLSGILEVSGTIKSSIADIIIGGNPNKESELQSDSFYGEIEKVAVYNRALSVEEIKAMSNEIQISDGKDLLRYLDFTI